MNNIGEKFLPIGTVCMLKGGTKRLMITGFCAIDNSNPNNMFDYSGCMFPEGFLSSTQTALFNHDQIEKIYHKGLEDEEEKNFKTQLLSIIDNMNKPNNKELEQQKENKPKLEKLDEFDISSIPPIGPGL